MTRFVTHRLALAAVLGIAALGPSCVRHEAAPDAPSALITASTGRRLRRLSEREYNTVVRDLLADPAAPAQSFGFEVYTNGFDNGSDGLIVSGPQLAAFQAAAEMLAARAVTADLAVITDGCDAAAGEGACVDAFFASFVPRAFRRPPTSAETTRLRAVYAYGAADGGYLAGLQLAVEAVLQSPPFLYREELGEPDPSLGPNAVRLTDHEVASELSFLITGSMPDAELFAAVERGELATGADLEREARRLLASPGARPALRAFMHRWLGTTEVANLSKDSGMYPAFTPALAMSMAQEMDDYYDQVLWEGAGSLREILTSTQSSIDPMLGGLYGVHAEGRGFRTVALDPTIRQGVLTRAGYLASHSDFDNSGPVPRGVYVLQQLLCSPPSPPPPNIPVLPPASQVASAHETTRQALGEHLTQPFCASCHARIDGIGFGFEEFDAIGAYRTVENTLPVDTSGALVGTDVDGPFVGASQLSAKLLTSKDALSCFVKQAYRFGMGDEENADAKALLASLESGFSVDARVSDLLLALVSTPAFVTRTTLASSTP